MDSGLDADASPRNDDVEKVQDWADRIIAARNRRPFTSLEDFARDTGLPKRALILLADADAFRSLGLDRREALWQVRRLPDDVPLPLFEAATAREQPDEGAKPLPAMPLAEQVVADYQTIRLSLKGHPMEFLREMFSRERVVACRDINHENERRRVRCAGVVLVRQRPGSASGVVFMTLEDETGIAKDHGAVPQGGDGRAPHPGRRLHPEQPRKGDASHRPAHGRPLARSGRPRQRCLEPQASGTGRRHRGRAAQRRSPRSYRHAGAKSPPPPQRPHPAALAGFSLKV